MQYRKLFVDEPEEFFINKLETIGVPDPFPKEEPCYDAYGKLPVHPIDCVYPAQRYTEGNSPYCLYIPNRDIMFKMMRACINVKKAEDLWLYA